jgi:hypothetical protein
MSGGEQAPPGVDSTIPSPARMYGYGLGGTHHYKAGRDAAEKIRALLPEIGDVARASRGFHQRAATWIAGRGIRQFIDIGSGLPATGNTHQVVQKVSPDARVVYVGNDPVAHAQCAAKFPTKVTITPRTGIQYDC